MKNLKLDSGQFSPLSRSAGFSASELMIVVAIIGILSVFAVPGYVKNVQNNKRIDGQTDLLTMMHTQERHRTETMSYAGSMQDLLEDSDGSNWRVTESGNYRVRVMNINANACKLTEDCIRLRLQPLSGGEMDGDYEMTIWSNGRKQYRLGSSGGWTNGWPN